LTMPWINHRLIGRQNLVLAAKIRYFSDGPLDRRRTMGRLR
jgi:hypothetical protein